MSVNIDSAAANLTAADVAADQMQRSPIAAGVEEAEAEAAQTRLGADGSSSASEASESDDEHAAAAASIELPAVEEDEPEEPAPPTEPSAAEPEKPRVLPPPRELFEVDTPDPLLQPPKTGNGNPMLYPPPRHVTAEPAEPQPLQPNASLHMLAAQLMAADAERLQNPALSLNRVVYDSNEPLDMATNPFVTAESLHSVHPPLSKRKEAAAAAAAAAANNNGGAAGEPSSSAALRFESRFESGNLRRAVQVSEYEYDLILRPDANTRGHTQWFYFGVAKMKHGPLYKFNVVNCVKPDSLFNAGMLPLVYSTKEVARTGLGWRRMGHNVCYYQNHIKRRTGYYYTASFQIRFLHADDVCYLAYCHPYTMSDLGAYLKGLEDDPKTRKRFRRRPLCETLAGNTVELLTITSFTAEPDALASRKGVVVSARVHPGETNASYMMKGIIDYLTGPSLDAKILRDNFVFKIIPVLNPDGVVVGNYRCSLAGLDLNRMWKDPSKRLTPTVWHAKQMMKRLSEDRELVLFCDLHGHSRKHNIFCYGCEQKSLPDRRLSEMIFSRLLWRNSASFSFSDCNFKVQRSKESTARVVVFKQLGILNSLTMEASFAGANFGRHAGVHFTPAMLMQMGQYFCDTILDYFDPDQSRLRAVYDELLALYPPGTELSGGGEDSAGSDDNPSEDCADPAELEQQQARRKKEKKEKKGGDAKSKTFKAGAAKRKEAPPPPPKPKPPPPRKKAPDSARTKEPPPAARRRGSATDAPAADTPLSPYAAAVDRARSEAFAAAPSAAAVKALASFDTTAAAITTAAVAASSPGGAGSLSSLRIGGVGAAAAAPAPAATIGAALGNGAAAANGGADGGGGGGVDRRVTGSSSGGSSPQRRGSPVPGGGSAVSSILLSRQDWTNPPPPRAEAAAAAALAARAAATAANGLSPTAARRASATASGGGANLSPTARRASGAAADILPPPPPSISVAAARRDAGGLVGGGGGGAGGAAASNGRLSPPAAAQAAAQAAADAAAAERGKLDRLLEQYANSTVGARAALPGAADAAYAHAALGAAADRAAGLLPGGLTAPLPAPALSRLCNNKAPLMISSMAPIQRGRYPGGPPSPGGASPEVMRSGSFGGGGAAAAAAASLAAAADAAAGGADNDWQLLSQWRGSPGGARSHSGGPRRPPARSRGASLEASTGALPPAAGNLGIGDLGLQLDAPTSPTVSPLRLQRGRIAHGMNTVGFEAPAASTARNWSDRVANLDQQYGAASTGPTPRRASGGQGSR